MLNEDYSQALLQEEPSNALAKASKYALNPKNLSSRKNEFIKHGVVVLVSLTGGALYVIPAKEFAQNLPFFEQINFIICTASVSLMVLHRATHIFFTEKMDELELRKFKDFLDLKSNKDLFIDYMIIGVGSIISAIPLALVSVAYPIFSNKILSNIFSIIVGADNAVLHFLPLDLALRIPLYRFPILPFEYLWKRFLQQQVTQEMQKAQADEIRLKDKFIAPLLAVQENLFKISLQDEMTEFTNISIKDTDNDEEAIQKVLSLIALAPEKPAMTPCAAWKNSKWGTSLKNAAYILGAGWVISSASGYLIQPITTLTSIFSSELAGVLTSVPPLYFFTVLLAFFGGNSLTDFYSYLTDWENKTFADKIPAEAKFYPKAFAVLMVVTVYLSIFSYGAAAWLVENNFNDPEWDWIRPYLLWAAKTGVPFLGLSAGKDFFQSMLCDFAIYFDQDKPKMFFSLHKMLQKLITIIRQMNKEHLIASLENLTPEQLAILDIQQEDLQPIKNNLLTLKHSDTSIVVEAANNIQTTTDSTSASSWIGSWCTWLSGGSTQRSAQTYENLDTRNLPSAR